MDQLSRDTHPFLHTPPPRPYGPRRRPGEPRACRGCGGEVPPELKLHEHPACAAARRAGIGPACEACGCTDRRVLRRHRLACGQRTLCANDAAIAGRRALTLEELRAEVAPRAA